MRQNYDDGGNKSGSRVVQMDEGYGDGCREALLLLAQSYEKQGEQDKANAYYQKIIEEHEGTQAATDAQEALDTQNAQKSKKNNN
ncbi:MAG: tetratricopeptide repeat protein [Dorea sp.]